MDRFVYGFADGGRYLDDLLGGKGAGLAEMTRMGLPVPPGFTITTEACRAFLATGSEPVTLGDEVARALTRLESDTRERFGPDRPLLFAVRSGGKNSVPGMMDTVLNAGLNEETVERLAAWSGDELFAWVSYSRFVRSFAETVLGVAAEAFDPERVDAARKPDERPGTSLDVKRFRVQARVYKEIVREETGEDFPEDPRRQLDLAIRAVFASWNGERARIYREREHISDDLGTAVNVCLMVFGSLGEDSGTGVAFTRDPATGAPGVYGDYLRHAVGADIVAGIRDTAPLSDLKEADPDSYTQLCQNLRALEDHYRDMCDIEFTVEHGTLWMLQTRIGERSAEAAFRVAADLVDEGVITQSEAVLRVTGERLEQLLFPQFSRRTKAPPIATGVAASPGAAVGRATFTSEEAARRKAGGGNVILVRPQTRPEDLKGMLAADGILTGQGGRTSHAAVAARGLGRPCVCGADQLAVDVENRRFTTADRECVEDGDLISIDGSTGAVYAGRIPVVASPVVRHFEGEDRDDSSEDAAEAAPGETPGDVVRAVERILGWADAARRLGVQANADTPADAAVARRFGAEGVGLCRTEHMFLGDRREMVEQLILAETDSERQDALDTLLPVQREDFRGILRAMDGLPVTVRLLDPPLHEFLPGLTELTLASVMIDSRHPQRQREHRLLEAVRRMHEENPVLGLRGVRLGITVPGLYAMQARALAEAAAALAAEGLDPRPHIMVPLVGDVAELRIVRAEIEQVLAGVAAAARVTVPCPIGTMIELPRAALTAGEIAGAAEFFSFGTDDLTQTTWGFSRDDAEGSFFSDYLDRGVFEVSPFERIDPVVGRLVRTAVEDGRKARPGLGLGVCGEHGGDAASIHFFDRAGLDYVSCSPDRILTARLEAGRAALLDEKD